EVVYLAPMSELEAGFEALRLLDQGQVDAAITDNFAADMAEERFPEVRRRLRSLSQSALTSAGVVVAWPDGPAGSPDAFRTALEEIDPELIIPLTEYGGFLALDEPLYQTMAEALRKVGLTAGQLVANRPPEPWSPPNLPRRPHRPEARRVALVPGAGMSIGANRFTAPLLKARERASEDMGLELLVHETPPEEHPADGALGFIESGLDVLVTVGWADPDLLWGLADAFPEVTFVDFGHTYGDEQPNLLSFVYRIEEAGLLAGALAGQASQVGRVAVVSGPLTPVLEQLLVGFEIGIQLTCSDCELTTAAADSLVDAALGEQIGREVVQGGADVVFNAAGGTGSAAIRAAAQEGAWVIGMDWNEYLTTFRGGEVPNADRLLGSVVRRVDAQAYDAIAAIVRGDFRPGTVSVGVREGGIEYLPSPKAAHPEAPALQAMVRDLARDLEQGEFGP
ncbi:MAG: BMP family ABC transporter substrate-binding protein, partial [Chloroflexi bacterium]|nr:BMP family ABC transporter substrate-binding protein [Chloroflexota bacterium]